MIQTLLVIASITLAAVFIGRMVYRIFKPSAKACEKCAVGQVSEEL